MAAKKKPASSKKKKSQSSDSQREDFSPAKASGKDDMLGNGIRPAPAAQLGQGFADKDRESTEDISSSRPVFQRDRSLDSLIIEEPKGMRLDQGRTGGISKRPLIEIPEDAVVPDPKTRQAENSNLDSDAAFGLSGDGLKRERSNLDMF
jgi:hypothetical protein